MSEYRLLTSQEAAERLGVSRSTMQRWIDAGEIRSFRTMGKHRRIDETDLKEFAARQGIPYRPLEGTELPLLRAVLAVDDEPSILKMLELHFRKRYADVPLHTTANGFEAGALIATLRPAVLLLDLQMPGMDGVEVCRVIRQMPEGRRIRIAAITAHVADKELIAKFQAAGGEQIFAKPLDIKEVFAFIDEALPKP